MIAKGSIQEVQQRADIVEIVGNVVKLKKRGSNYTACCPFHNEKTPSFSVSASKGIFKCFGCGRGGDVVSFVMEQEKLPYIDAIRWLADYYKIELEETERSPEQAVQYKIEESLRALNEFAAQWFSDTLKNTDEGRDIGLSYLQQRGIRGYAIDSFRLGYNPEQEFDGFLKAATSAGYTLELLEKAGLIRERNGSHYDAYRGRVIFPIQSNTGKVVGFGARILRANDRAPKYINTPENELYLKSRILYGLYQARQAIGKKDECLLTEGYLDVISLSQEGIEHVVASSGTSLTEDQLRLVGQLTKNLTIVYDSDAAGIKAALRGLDMALAQGFNVRVALLPAGEDPDSLVQKLGREGFEAYVEEHKKDVLGFRLELGLKDAETDPAKKNALVNEIAESISGMTRAEDFALRQHWVREAARRLDVDEAGLIALVNKYTHERLEAHRRSDRHHPGRDAGQQPPPTPDPDAPEAGLPAVLSTAADARSAQEWQLIRMLLEHGREPYGDGETVAGYLEQIIAPELIDDPLALRFFELYYEQCAESGCPDETFFTRHPDDALRTRAAQILIPEEEISPKWKEDYGIQPLHEDRGLAYKVDSTVVYFELRKNKQLMEQVLERMQTEQDPERAGVIMRRYLDLKKAEQEISARMGTVILKYPG